MDKMEKQEKKDIEDKIALTQFSRELELLHLQHRQSFYQGLLVVNSTLFALLIAHFERLQSPTEVERTLFLYLGVLLLLGILLGGIVLIRCLRQIRQYSQDCRRLASQRHERLEEKIAELHQKYDSKFLAPSVVSYTIVADIFLIGLTILLWLLSRSFSTESYAYALILLVVQHYPIVLFFLLLWHPNSLFRFYNCQNLHIRFKGKPVKKGG